MRYIFLVLLAFSSTAVFAYRSCTADSDCAGIDCYNGESNPPVKCVNNECHCPNSGGKP